MTFHSIKTSRLLHRPFTENDKVPLYDILRERNILKYFPNNSTPDMERVERIIHAQLKHYEDHDCGWWAVELIGEGKLIGWNGLQYLPETDEVEVGYLLSRSKWGLGLATEGARASLTYGFSTLNIKQIIGITHLENRGSQNVLEKIGMHSRERTMYFGMNCYKYIKDSDDHTELNCEIDIKS